MRRAQRLCFTLKGIAEPLRPQVTPGVDHAAVRSRVAGKLAVADRRLIALAQIRAALVALARILFDAILSVEGSVRVPARATP
jgi:hypothetical protein